MPLSTDIGSVVNSDKERKKDRREESSAGSAPLSAEVDSIINHDSLEQSQGVSEYIPPSSTEARSLIDPESFECSNERK